MKPETLELLKAHQDKDNFTVEFKESDLHFLYTLTDSEVREIVEAEYGPSITQSQDELFRVIIKKLLQMGIEYAKANSSADSSNN